MIVVIVIFRFGGDLETLVPPLPPRPAPVDVRLLARADYTPEIYAAHLGRDAQALGLAPATPAEMAAPFAHEKVMGPRALAAGQRLDLGALRLSLSVRPLVVHMSGGSLRTDHLVLSIENRGAVPVAYRVGTSPEGNLAACWEKADLGHNAAALLPGERVERTECKAGRRRQITIDEVETIALPPLAYHYASRLTPTDAGEQVPATRGHLPPTGEPCRHVDAQAIKRARERGQATWRDVVDFHARHRCETYRFVPGYRAPERVGERAFPVAPER